MNPDFEVDPLVLLNLMKMYFFRVTIMFLEKQRVPATTELVEYVAVDESDPKIHKH